ncbi:E3 ubiquitin-protein ligase SIAH1-like [Scleropages formosus]|uniref:E3 ubiquitin-protein ligase SIAH1-like n=1 Tax=Scleropages formosus TaxID=113540 RepID=UPI0010FAA66B|nr:E3 ubiquitin-protein ligase SIAH2 [Scleropages formosus]XP_018603844.2 E3 ubiquitin-protein ligase SIAH2 [Scleropages formosus]
MKEMSSSPPLPCKFATTGCPLTLRRTAKLEHEELCKFQPYSCPCPGTPCRWQGSLDAVVPHLKQQHKSITTLQGKDILFTAAGVDLPGTINWVMVQSCFGFHFLLVLEKRERPREHQQFFALVLLIGTRKQAKKFVYRLELSKSSRLLAWEASPRSILEGVASVITNTDCLVFDKATARLFAENGNLDINVSICYT